MAKVGRPTKYKPEFCERVIELGREGMSPAEIAGELGVAKASLLNWGEQHEEFLTALTRAKTLEQVWWEGKARAAMRGEVDFNPQIWKTSMQARFREDYTERRDNTHSGPSGGPIEVISPKDRLAEYLAVHKADDET